MLLAKIRLRSPSNRRGAMLVLVAVTLIIFVVAMVFSIDVAYMQLVRSQLRAAADAAAKAGAQALTSEQNDQAAVTKAQDVAAQNIVAGEPLRLASADIELGKSVVQSDGSWNFVPGGQPYSAVRVTANRSAGSPSGAVRLFVGSLLGVETFEPVHIATASQLDQDVVLVVDRSGSMAFDLSGVDWQYPSPLQYPDAYCRPPHATLSRWAAARAAIDAFLSAIDNTRPTEHVSVVSFSSDTVACSTTVRAATTDSQLSPDYSLARAAMAQLSSRPIPGGTNIGAGIDQAVSVLKGGHARRFAQKTIIVMTDGHWTDGNNPVDAAIRAANDKITVHSITFSNNADEALMREVARVGNGKHYHAPDAAALSAIYEEIAYTLPIILTE